MEKLLTELRAVAESTRLRLLALLGESELTVTELTQILGQSQPRISRHLKLMCEAGLIERFREGTWAFYRLSEEAEIGLAGRIMELLADTNGTLALDRQRLEAVKKARAEAAARYFRENARDWDRIRSLHVAESQVEAAILDMLGDDEVGEVLDIGTGTGRMLELLASRARRGVGIDLSREMLAVARSNLEQKGLANCQVRQGDMYNLALPNESVDVVTVHQVLHYADDPAAAVAEAARVLRPGGRLMIVDFAPHDLEFLRSEHAHRRLGFTNAEVNRWCRAAGLSVEEERRLAGKDLTVCLWLAVKDAVRVRRAGAA